MSGGFNIKQDQAKRAMKVFRIILPFLLILPALILPSLPSSPMMRDAFWASKFTQKAICDYVIIGDSRAYRGIDPSLFPRSLHRQAFNFGFSSASPDSALIEHALNALSDTGKRTVIITISANSFMSGSIDNRHYHSVESWSPTDKYLRTELYPWISFFDNYNVSDLYKTFKHEAYYEHFGLGTGFAASDKVPLDSNSALPAYRKQFELEQYSKAAELSFKRYVLRLKSKGYRVLVLRMPCTNAMLQLEDSATNRAIPLLLKEMQAGGIMVMPFYSEGMISYDGSHLRSESSRAFTYHLMDYLKDSCR